MCKPCIETSEKCTWCEEYIFKTTPDKIIKCIKCGTIQEVIFCCEDCEEDFHKDICDGFVCMNCMYM